MAQILDLVQGSPEWLAHRAKHFNASDAAAMMGISPHKTRAQLLKEMATGLAPDVSKFTQRLFDQGHEYEAIARTWAEEILGESLYPVVLSDGRLSASLDGLTMDDSIVWEHKTLNASLAESLGRDVIPDEYHPQLEQQCMLSGATSVLFMASAGDRATMRTAVYQTRPNLRADLIAGWAQFEKDLQEYKHEQEDPAVVAADPDALPVLTVQLVGQVQTTNLPAWRNAITARIATISTDLQTDEDFARADRTVKFLDEGEKRLDLCKEQALAQTASIDELFRAIDQIKAEMRAKRLNLDKLVKARKESVRLEIVQSGSHRLAEFIAAFGLPHRIDVSGNFAGCVKGLKTLASLRNAVDTELARAKIEATGQAETIRKNLAALAEIAPEQGFLFRDLDGLVRNDCEHFSSVAKARVSDYAAERERKAAELERQRQAAEARRIEEEQRRAAAEEARKAEAERQRIVAEQQRAADEARRAEAAERQRIEMEARLQEQAKQLAALQDEAARKAKETAVASATIAAPSAFTARQIDAFLAQTHGKEATKSTARAYIVEFGKYLAKMQAEKAA